VVAACLTKVFLKLQNVLAPLRTAIPFGYQPIVVFSFRDGNKENFPFLRVPDIRSERYSETADDW
jgi:hypothetical protein